MAACAHARIPNTSVDDTEENRTIYELLLTYERAIEARDTDAVLAMVSPQFYEDNGNTDKDDDYDLTGLKASLSDEFNKTKKIQVDMNVDAIQVEDAKAYAYVFFTLRARSEFPSGEKWKTASDRARIVFAQEDDKWLIISGL